MQILRRLEEYFNRRDFDAYVQLLDPAIEWHVAREDPETTVHHGRDAVRGYLQGWIDAFADLRFEIEDGRDAGDGVLVVIRMHGHGTGSSVPLDERVNFLFTLRDGRLTKVEEYFDRDEAVSAAALVARDD